MSPPRSTRASSSTTSYSSLLSPIRSSMRSSRVTMPPAPPSSSTAAARWSADRRTSGEADERVGALGEEQDHRPHQPGEAFQRRPQDERSALGALKTEPLRHQLAQQDSDVGDGENNDDETDDVRSPLRQPGPLHRITDRMP